MSAIEDGDIPDRYHCTEHYGDGGPFTPGEEAFFRYPHMVYPEASPSQEGPLFFSSQVIRIRIGLLPSKTLKLWKRLDHQVGPNEAPPTPPDDEHHYWAEAFKNCGKLYYRVNGTTVEISEDELREVVNNRYLFYFSTAWKLHRRIERQWMGLPPRVDANVVQLVTSGRAFLNIRIKKG